MKHSTHSKRSRFLLLVILIAGLISLDFLLSTNGVEEGTFRLESEFDVISGATTTVGLVPSDYSGLANPVSREVNPSYEQVEDMVRKAIELQGGLDWVINPGDKVMIKVNLVGADSPSGQGENTDVRVVKALIKIINDFTAGDVTIQVAEGSARTNDDPTKVGSVWDNSGYRDLLTDPYLDGINLSLLNLNQTVNDLVEVDVGKKGSSAIQGTKYHVHQAELEADVYIDVPVLKIHDTGITNALKLQVGSAPGSWYGYNKMTGTANSVGLYHDVGQRRWTSEMIVDLSLIADIDFVVVDAIMCLDEYKTYKGYNQVRMNTIVAGADPVAVDHVCTRLFCLNPDDIAHITLAEKVGLGTNDPDKIIVEGATIENVRKKVTQNPSPDGVFGQSNRTWLLSQAFDGTSVEEDYIADEANLIPVAGENGWSEAVYFFDDRIDLLSYYNGKTNMVSYAFTYFDAPKDQVAELWLGTHEGMEVFLNGEMVYSYYSTNSAFNDAARGDYVKDINIKKGENRLLVKTLNKFGDYTFTLNICDKAGSFIQKGNRVDGLTFYTRSTGTGIQDFLKSGNSGLLEVYPNPATEQVNIRFNADNNGMATINVYSLNGELVMTILHNQPVSGEQRISWSLENDLGQRVPSGVYICTVRSGDQMKSVKLVVQ